MSQVLLDPQLSAAESLAHLSWECHLSVAVHKTVHPMVLKSCQFPATALVNPHLVAQAMMHRHLPAPVLTMMLQPKAKVLMHPQSSGGEIVRAVSERSHCPSAMAAKERC